MGVEGEVDESVPEDGIDLAEEVGVEVVLETTVVVEGRSSELRMIRLDGGSGK